MIKAWLKQFIANSHSTVKPREIPVTFLQSYSFLMGVLVDKLGIHDHVQGRVPSNLKVGMFSCTVRRRYNGSFFATS